MQSVQLTIEAFEIYKATELAALIQKQEAPKEPEPAAKVTEEKKVEEPVKP